MGLTSLRRHREAREKAEADAAKPVETKKKRSKPSGNVEELTALATGLKIDMDAISGTGKDGAVLKSDIVAAIEAAQAAEDEE